MLLFLLSLVRHSRESGNPGFPLPRLLKVWVPAFAGMTVKVGMSSAHAR